MWKKSDHPAYQWEGTVFDSSPQGCWSCGHFTYCLAMIVIERLTKCGQVKLEKD